MTDTDILGRLFFFPMTSLFSSTLAELDMGMTLLAKLEGKKGMVNWIYVLFLSPPFAVWSRLPVRLKRGDTAYYYYFYRETA